MWVIKTNECWQLLYCQLYLLCAHHPIGWLNAPRFNPSGGFGFVLIQRWWIHGGDDLHTHLNHEIIFFPCRFTNCRYIAFCDKPSKCPTTPIHRFLHSWKNIQRVHGKRKKVLKANGFEEFDIHEDSKYRTSSVKGYHKSESLTAEIECNQKLGITSFGVSSLDNEITYKMYGKLFDAEW